MGPSGYNAGVQTSNAGADIGMFNTPLTSYNGADWAELDLEGRL